jgi:hypothetical protein
LATGLVHNGFEGGKKWNYDGDWERKRLFSFLISFGFWAEGHVARREDEC